MKQSTPPDAGRSDIQEIGAYKRQVRKVHSGGRPEGDIGKGGRVKLNTSLPAHVRSRLQRLADHYSCPVSDVISTLVFCLVEAQHYPDMPHHEMVEYLLSGSGALGGTGRVGPDPSTDWTRQWLNEARIKAGKPVAPHWNAEH
jgi:hypothetical protein